ncbi:Zinc finger protein 423 [Labeo rohita]|uniref:Zinc finger protein 423 n=1 Tax=Labeo rohita TaxID=84645 RepID=A0ABQ8L8A6_LABRO|nr:Zinc finger protein 423 [Labeo rohita]
MVFNPGVSSRIYSTLIMSWPCKYCKFETSKHLELLKHYRLKHPHTGQGCLVPCLHLNCPCSFKGWGALRAHLCRDHAQPQQLSQTVSFSCLVCNSFNCHTGSQFFEHIGILNLKGGVVGTKLRPYMDILSQDNHGDTTLHTLKILVVHGADGKDPVDVSIILEGKEILPGCHNTAKACALLMGLIYALNLAYPRALRYTFEVFLETFSRIGWN